MSEQQLVLMRMPLGPLGTNCYVIGDKALETKGCFANPWSW